VNRPNEVKKAEAIEAHPHGNHTVECMAPAVVLALIVALLWWFS
jgi:hypothetical protein